MEKIKLIECPRDAMQGLVRFIPTEDKINYINTLLKIGFDTLDVGSFVSPKMIPQMQDTPEVLDNIDLTFTKTKLLTIVGNKKGAESAVSYSQVDYLGYPFSISETFQIRNTNATIEESWSRLEQIQEVCLKNNKTLVVYLSMGFGNPYGDLWSPNLVKDWALKIHEYFKVKIISLSDTIGSADENTIKAVFESIMPYAQDFEVGAHLHAKPNDWIGKIQAALQSGCYRFDGAIKGFGGCPYAADSLTGNIPSEQIIEWFESKGFKTGLDLNYLRESVEQSKNVFL